MIVFFKGATAYEFQIGRLVIMVTHLRGAYWKWKFWRRLRIELAPKEEGAD